MNRSIVIAFFCLIIAAPTAVAQKRKSENLPGFDRRLFHFGFTIGLNSANMELQRSGPDNPRDSLLVVSPDANQGFNIGIVSSLSLAEKLKLRFIPTLSLSQRNIEYFYKYENNESETVIKTIESTYVDFPLYLKYKSSRLNNFQAYIIGGGKFSIDLASNELVDNSDKVPDDVVVRLKKNTFAWDIGVGTDFFLEYFKFGIEMKMSYTIGNAFVEDESIYSKPIEAIYPRMFLLSLTFEG